mgnify:CR=1 FL=1
MSDVTSWGTYLVGNYTGARGTGPSGSTVEDEVTHKRSNSTAEETDEVGDSSTATASSSASNVGKRSRVTEPTTN